MLTQLMLSPYWRSSAFLWSYDGSGGWYDHVAPPPGLGLRVPALLVSPYARAGQVDHTPLESVAALRFIEHNWGLPPLTARDAGAGDLTGAFDFTAAPRAADIIPVVPAPNHPPLVKVGIIYRFYGAAVLFVLVLLAVAVTGPRLRRRRRHPAPSATRQPRLEEEVPV